LRVPSCCPADRFLIVGLLDAEFLTVAEVAELLKLNQQTVRNWIDAGYLKAFHVGRRVRILRSDLEELLERSRTQPPAPQTDSCESTSAEGFWNGDVVPGPDTLPDGG
jgi:excisionase family DNA binding protein